MISAHPRLVDKLRPVRGANGAVGPPPMNPPTVRQISVPTTLSAGDFSALAGVTDERTKVKELLRHPRIMPSAVVLDPAITLHAPEWLSRLGFVRWIIASKASARMKRMSSGTRRR